MNHEELLLKIKEIVEEKQGCKANELACDLTIATLGAGFESEELIEAMDEAVRVGLIKEIEYVLPNMDYRVKSFYLPADTKIHIRIVGGREDWLR